MARLIARFCRRAEPKRGAWASSFHRWRAGRSRAWRCRFPESSRLQVAEPSEPTLRKRLPVSRQARKTDTLAWTSTLSRPVDLYDQLADLGVSCWVTGGFYAKQKVFDTAGGLGGDLITRLRSDANLRQATAIYTGPPKEGPGAPKQYDGKIDWDDREVLRRRFNEVGRLPDQPQVRIPATVASSLHFGRDLRVVLLIGPEGEQVILASTDTAQHAEEVVRYYRLRYQIELVIRDAKQHTGLTHCQARSQEKLDFHLNMSCRLGRSVPIVGPESGVFASHLPARSVQSAFDRAASLQTRPQRRV